MKRLLIIDIPYAKLKDAEITEVLITLDGFVPQYEVIFKELPIPTQSDIDQLKTDYAFCMIGTCNCDGNTTRGNARRDYEAGFKACLNAMGI